MRKFKVVAADVKYPTFFQSGKELHEIGGTEVLQIDPPLAETFQIGQEVTENHDFEVLPRKIVASYQEKSAVICDKGEIAGGSNTKDGWIMIMMGGAKIPASELTPINHAHRLESYDLVEKRQWYDLRASLYVGDRSTDYCVDYVIDELIKRGYNPPKKY